MKTMKFLTYAVFVMFLGLAINSCTGPDGPEGPAGTNGIDGVDGVDGADGADGADGVDGADGIDGEDGEDGNANVIYSDWIVPTWSENTFYGMSVQEYNIATPDLTQEIVDNGVVLMYWKNFEDHVWMLPKLLAIYYFEFEFTLNNIHLYYSYPNDYTTMPPAIPESNVFRYVLIPGGNAAGKSTLDSQQIILDELKNAGVDVNDFEQVCDYYGINPE